MQPSLIKVCVCACVCAHVYVFIFKINLHTMDGILNKHFMTQGKFKKKSQTIAKVKIYIGVYPLTVCFNWGNNLISGSVFLSVSCSYKIFEREK